MANKKLNFLLPFLFSLMLAGGMFIGLKLRDSFWYSEKPEGKDDYARLYEVMRLVESHYVDTLNREQTVNNLISDMLSRLDPHSYYIPASELNAVNESLEGNFEGIGIEFYILRDTIIVVTPISGGPSEALGIMSGDKIIRIDDVNVAGTSITNNEVVKKLRGNKGTKVKVSIARKSREQLLDFTITRDKIPLTSVDVAYMADDETGYIKISRFSATTYDEFMAGLRKLKTAGMTRLVIDLRYNPGGYLNAATMIADELIGGDHLLVYTQGKSSKRKEIRARLKGAFENGALAIIINEGSASASEILAGAVQDLDRGIITGMRSFGKGLVQEQENLSDGSALRLTVARYYTPSGRSIQKPYASGIKEYDGELAVRFDNGEYAKPDSSLIADSLKFFTLKGKPVYGGGGIMPDVFIPLDSISRLQKIIKVRSYLPEFIYDYYPANADKFSRYENVNDFSKNYEVPDALYASFISAAQSKGLELKEHELNALMPQTKTLIKAQLARQIWRDEGFFFIYNSMDSTILKTITLLKQ